MDAIASAPAADDGRAIQFSGTLGEFLPIAISNFLLTIVTLFIYRSWAKARERRYLWSRTRFIDDQLQWTGTGLEMFIGFVVVAVVLGVAYLGFVFGLQALVARVGPLALLVVLLLYVGGFYLYGLARFRGLRYRLSRTWWRGIRGGSDDPGFSYAGKAVGYYFATFFLAGLFYPWAQAKLWNQRWNKMSFGPQNFEATMTTDDTSKPFFIMWGAIVVGSVILAVTAGPGVEPGRPSEPNPIVALLFYAGVGLAYLGFLSAYYRAAAEWTRIGDIEFRFNADFSDWLKFYAATIGLAIITLGLAMIVYNFRYWRFVTSHLEVYGAVDVDQLTQSQTRAPREAEGFLDALDIGAF